MGTKDSDRFGSGHNRHLDRGSRCRRRVAAAATILISGFFLGALSGCQLGPGSLDVDVVRGARASFQDHYENYNLPGPGDSVAEREEPSFGSYVLGELIAIFPGLFVPGLGHYYAGDHKTARELRNLGEIGYVFSALGAGFVAGGYFLDEEDDKEEWTNVTYSLYGTGAFFGLVGVGYIVSAWFYDMIDTPRAIESGGDPPPRTPFVKALNFFD